IQLVDAGRFHRRHIRKHGQAIRRLLSPRQLHAVEKGRRRRGNPNQNPRAACLNKGIDSNNQFTAHVKCSLLIPDCPKNHGVSCSHDNNSHHDVLLFSWNCGETVSLQSKRALSA
ncbi:unnamed protein product, partial [Ectocarpus sp. 13 AM-2016]